jgi:hypothetical protein
MEEGLYAFVQKAQDTPYGPVGQVGKRVEHHGAPREMNFFADDNRNAYAKRYFASPINQLASAIGSASDETGDFRGKPSPPGDRLAANKEKMHADGKAPDKTTVVAWRNPQSYRVPQRRKWHSRRQSSEKPHSNKPTLAIPDASVPHSSAAGIWLNFGRHSQVRPGSSSDSLRGSGTLDCSSAVSGPATAASNIKTHTAGIRDICISVANVTRTL